MGILIGYAYVEQFLSRLAHAQADEGLTDAVAQWTWTLWHNEQILQEPEQEEQEAVFYVDGHRKAVYSDVLVPRGPVGKLGGKILGCRELVVLHDDEGHPSLSTTHRGDQHLTQGTPQLLHAMNRRLTSRTWIVWWWIEKGWQRSSCFNSTARDGAS